MKPIKLYSLFTVLMLSFPVWVMSQYFTSSVLGTNQGSLNDVVIDDLNGDGHLDIIHGDDTDNDIFWWKNDGNANPTFTSNLVTNNAGGVVTIRVIDLDGDGNKDVLAASDEHNNINWYRNSGGLNPTFQRKVIISPFKFAAGTDAGDLDGDGIKDVAGASRDLDQVWWWKNSGGANPTWTGTMIESNLNGVFNLVIADLNGDNDLDIAVNAKFSNMVVWYESNGASNPSFTKRIIDNGTANNPNDLLAVDIEKDGDIDLLCAVNLKQVVLYENNGANPVSLLIDTTFSVAAQPATNPIAISSSRPFDITFSPPAVGSFTDTISIANNDPDENPFTFVIQGTGVCPSNTVIYVDSAASGANNGSSWTDAFNYLQDALEYAEVCTNVEEIWVAKGTYFPDDGANVTVGDRDTSFVLRNNLAIYGGFSGTENMRSARDSVSYATILCGDLNGNDIVNNSTSRNDNSYHVIYTNGVDATAHLNSLIISGGGANGGGVNNMGGGMLNINSSPSVSNCTFLENFASNSGGGMGNDNAHPFIRNTKFMLNSAFGGGGMINDNGATPTMLNCIFNANAAQEGGAIVNFDSSPILTHCTLVGNSGGPNGGISNFAGNPAPIITNCILWDNDVSIAGGNSVVTYSIVEGGFPGVGNLNQDPLVVNSTTFPTIGDLHLQACSPAIDAGSNTGAPTDDLDGNARPFNATGTANVDMGAYEYQSVVTGPTALCEDITVGLDASGMVTVLASEVDNGSSDACGAVSLLIDGGSSKAYDCDDKGMHTVTLTVTNSLGNTATCTASITVEDNILPQISCPSGITQSNDAGMCDAVVTYAVPSGTDNCSGQTTMRTAGLGSGGSFSVGTHTETYTVTDVAGNTASCSFTVTINDSELPQINCPGNITQNNDPNQCSAIVNYVVPSGTDNCPGQTTALTAGLGDGGTFPVGVTTETYTVTDATGNTASCSFTVTIEDTDGPAFNCPSSNVVRNTDPGMCDHLAVGADLDVSTSDACGLQTLTNDYTNTNSLAGAVFPKGRTVVTWTATDIYGNSTTCAYNIRIRDREAPVFDNCPDDTTIVVAPYSGGSYHTWPALTATDNCNNPGQLSITGFPLSGSFFSVGTLAVNWTATDKRGNVGHCDFDVTVVEQGSAAPTGWTDNGVGNSNGCHTNWDGTTGTLTIQSAGGNVSINNDNFCAVTIPNSQGIIDFRARVIPAGNSYYDQAGIMMRQNLTSTSTHATMLLTGTSVPVMSFRPAPSSFPLSTPGTAVSKPYWLRLYRAGGTITGYISADGTNWSQVATYPNLLSSPLYLVLFSTTAGPTGQATIDHITINGAAPRLGEETIETEMSLKAYPNPFSEYLFIEVENALPGERYQVRLSNMMGQRVYGYETGASAAGTIDQRISLEELAAGTYLLEVSAGVQRQTLKVVKQ